ncbi:MAG TPA: ankyrin repeat domain-containing protein [Chthoniobacteraceae bacterium]|nr:ankyrin repeat domain-containing protein [Chthoniobacteraceae bacterium]
MNAPLSFPLPLPALAAVSSVSVALAWVLTLLLRRKSAALRHLVWSLALCAPLVALPFACWPHAPRISLPVLRPVPARQSPARPAPGGNQDAASPVQPIIIDRTAPVGPAPSIERPIPQKTFSLPLNPWLAAWLAGGIFVALRILASNWRARRLLRTGCLPAEAELSTRLDAARKSFRYARSVRLLVSPLAQIPFCHGIFRPVVVFPRNWREWEADRVEICMAHEMAHIVRRDLHVMLAGQLACALCWFNPLAWFAAARLRDEAEIAADDMVLARDFPPETYAAALLAITEKCRAPGFLPATALSMARPSRLKTRIVSILDSSLARKSPGLRVIVALSLAVAAAVVSVVSIRLTAPLAAAKDATEESLKPLPIDPGKREQIMEQIRAALEAGDIKAVDAFLKRGIDVNELCQSDPLLYWAVDADKPELVGFLIAKGADVNKPTTWGDTCFKRACWRGFKDIADILTKAGAKRDYKEDLFYYCGTGDVKGLEELDAKTPIKGDATEGDDVEGGMAFAAASGHQNTLEWLWKHKAPADPQKQAKLIGSLYGKAASWNQAGILRYLETLGKPTPDSLTGALEEACSWNHLEEAKCLLEKGVSPNIPGEKYSILRNVAGEGHIEMVKLLLEHGADINAKDGQGMTPLAWAAYNGHDDVCALLLEHGADGSITDDEGRNAAWYCAGGAHNPATLEMLLKKGVKVTGKDKRGTTILQAMMFYSAPRPNHVAFPGKVYTDAEIKEYNARERRAIDLLVAAGADMNGPGHASTPLMSAIQIGHFEAARALIDDGADLAVVDEDGNTAFNYIFTWCTRPLPVDILETLLKHGADPNAPVFNFGTKGRQLGPAPIQAPPLEDMISWGPGWGEDKGPDDDALARKAVKLLIDHGAVFPKADGNAQALLKAAALGNLAGMKEAVQKGAPIDAADANGWNALTISVGLGNMDCVDWLVANHAKMDTVTAQGYSPLSFAAMRAEPALVEKFIAAGAKPAKGLGAGLGYAIRNKDQRTFDALIKAGADPNSGGIFNCIQTGQVAMAKTLLEAGADTESMRTSERRNSVYWAVYYNQPEILKLLLEHGADPAMQDAYGETPLSFAQQFYKDMVPILAPYVKKTGTVAFHAAVIANAEAKKNFGVEPFAAGEGDPDFTDGRWKWHVSTKTPKGTFDADVSFTANDTDPKVDVKQTAAP